MVREVEKGGGKNGRERTVNIFTFVEIEIEEFPGAISLSACVGARGRFSA